jgi:two-component system, OmpR family, response regulator VanR
VLVVEDEEILAEAPQAGLRRHAMAVDVALGAESALELLDVNAYDVVVLDRDLPGMHGDELCQLIVTGHPTCRVLMLTAARRLPDRVGGLRLGADRLSPHHLGQPKGTALRCQESFSYRTLARSGERRGGQYAPG